MLNHLFHMVKLNGGITYYGDPNRIPALYYVDFNFLCMLIIACGTACILLVLLPGIRRKCASLLLGVTSIATGAIILYCLMIPEWQIGYVTVKNCPLSYWSSNETYTVEVGLQIGLTGANITMISRKEPNIYYDTYMDFFTLDEMEDQYLDALVRGSPIPVLSVLGYLASGNNDFVWAYHVRRSGYYASCTLYGLFVTWCFANFIYILVPRYGAYVFAGMGCLFYVTNLIYWTLDPGFVDIYVHGKRMDLEYGSCFWTCMTIALWNSITGLSLSVLHVTKPNRIFTVFDLDYGDRRKAEGKETAKLTHYADINMESGTI